MARRVARGEVWTYTFHKPDKRRPVLVLSRPEAIEVLHTASILRVSTLI